MRLNYIAIADTMNSWGIDEGDQQGGRILTVILDLLRFHGFQQEEGLRC